MSSFVSLLGETLRQKDGKTVRTRECLDGKEVVALYFSAQWSPPCAKFTPYLVRQYNNVYMEKGMEIVFVSHDCDERNFRKAHNEVPFLALPFVERPMKDKLSKMCQVTDLPALVLYSPKGEIYNMDARKTISDPENFPWMPKSLDELLSGPFTGPKDSEVELETLSGKYIGLYFSATWCNPCKMFAPKLAAAYEKIKERDPAMFEILYVSDDLTEEQFQENYGKMPWLALPFVEREAKDQLRKIFNVRELPSLVILDKDQKTVLNENAKDDVKDDSSGLECPWVRQKAADRFANLLMGLQQGGQPLFGDKDSPPNPLVSSPAISSPTKSDSSSDSSSSESEDTDIAGDNVKAGDDNSNSSSSSSSDSDSEGDPPSKKAKMSP